mgnify:CR=1 FL=1
MRISLRMYAFAMRWRGSNAWRNQSKQFHRAYVLYGGAAAIVRSPYLHVAAGAALVLCLLPSRIRFGEVGLTVLPNLLGFTIGAMAIVLSVSSSNIFISLAEHGKPDSFFMKLVANFMHYIIVQALTIGCCVLEKGFLEVFWPLNYISATMFIYSILTPVAIGTQLFQMASIYNASASLKKSAAETCTSDDPHHGPSER